MEARRDDRSFAGRRDGRRGVGEDVFGEIRERSSRFTGARTMLGLERHCIAAASGVARAELSRRGVADEHARTSASRGGGTSLRSGGWLKTAARRDGTFFFPVVEKHECRKRKTLLELQRFVHLPDPVTP